ncbi:hypothetical protein F0L17_21055 [Streptomyces sp. TRM43335]|uniref:Nitroreductase n=1 Tax=Streptomyces taklimakanensis TaxID=2569853 RepID=A0A6G2BH05_9ACTN|nr:hypothetical protein [Streptomyces taklimakanensis]MTE21555.1 hypothetical protein [Streptomyces taklimakanensis]
MTTDHPTTPTAPTAQPPPTGPDRARAHRLVAEALARARSTEEPGPDRDPGPLVPALPYPALPVPPAAPGEVPLEAVLRLSLSAVGSGERRRDGGGGGRLRPHPSAGGCHPVGAHLLVGPGCPLPPGRYAYDPLTHRAHARGPAPGDAPAGVVAVLTVTPRRTTAHYGHRAVPLLLLDAGHAAAALVLAARAAAPDGAGTPVGAAVCPDADGPLLVAAAGLDHPAREEDEHPVLAVRLTPPGTRPRPDDLRRWAAPAGGGRPRPLDGEDAGAVLRALTAAPEPDPGRPGQAGQGTWWTPPPTAPAPSGADLLARRSAAPPLTGAVGDTALATVLAAAAAAGAGFGPGGPTWCAAVGSPRPALLEPASDGSGAPRRSAVGEARPTLAAWAARQGWLAEAGAVLLARGCPTGAPPHRVRTAHLAAGYAAGTAQAVAVRLGLRSRPVGAWQGADLGAALGEPPGRAWVVHGLALAGPEEAAEPDGREVGGP